MTQRLASVSQLSHFFFQTWRWHAAHGADKHKVDFSPRLTKDYATALFERAVLLPGLLITSISDNQPRQASNYCRHSSSWKRKVFSTLFNIQRWWQQHWNTHNTSHIFYFTKRTEDAAVPWAPVQPSSPLVQDARWRWSSARYPALTSLNHTFPYRLKRFPSFQTLLPFLSSLGSTLAWLGHSQCKESPASGELLLQSSISLISKSHAGSVYRAPSKPRDLGTRLKQEPACQISQKMQKR